jgi:hypothetical protein
VKPSWHRINTTVLGRGQEPGTATLFFDYNLAHWTFGVRVDPDHLWFTVYFEFGPITFDLTYWRLQPTDTGSVT